MRLQLVDVVRQHGSHVVLDGVTLQVSPGTRLGLVGPNGSGKSTVLRLLAGLEEPDAGTVVRDPPTLTGRLSPAGARLPGRRVGARLPRAADRCRGCRALALRGCGGARAGRRRSRSLLDGARSLSLARRRRSRRPVGHRSAPISGFRWRSIARRSGSRAVSRRGSRSRRSCSRASTCCSSTSRRTISTSTGSSGWSDSSRRRIRHSSSSRTTVPSSTGR